MKQKSETSASRWVMEEAWEPVHVSGTQDKAYYYSTYNAEDKNPVSTEKPKVMILGGGPQQNRAGY